MDPSAQPTGNEQDARNKEEYAVFSALIEYQRIGSMDGELVVIESETLAFASRGLRKSLKSMARNLPGLTDEICADFALQNQRSTSLKPLLKLSAQYLYLTAKEGKGIFRNKDGWDVFYTRYPNARGIVTLSHIGFNLTIDAALVYYGDQSHLLAGTGTYAFLKKENGEWVVKGEVMAWIS